MASTESGGVITQIGAYSKPVIGSLQSVYASSTWSFDLPVPNGARLLHNIVEVRSSAGAVKDTTVTLSGNTMTIAAGEDTLAGDDVATVIYTLQY